MSADAARPPSLFAKRKPPQRALVVVTRRIGDVLLATPVVRSLKSAWPQCAIDMLVFAGTEGFVAANPDVRRVLTVRERPRPLEHLRFMLRIARRYDLALSLVPGDRPTLYAYVAGKLRVGLLEPMHKTRWKQSLLHVWVPFDNVDTHTVRMHLALLQAIGVAPLADVVPSWTREDETRARALLPAVRATRYAVMHPYPKFRYKMWTIEGWVAVGRWLREHGYTVVLTGGPEDAERDYVSRIASQIPEALNLVGELTLGGVAYVISGATVYVGPDTAITHAAAALGVPTVALFGPTNPVKWGPWPAAQDVAENPWQRTGTQLAGRVHLVQGAGACVPCGNEGCEKHVESSSDCLTYLSPETVISAIRNALHAWA